MPTRSKSSDMKLTECLQAVPNVGGGLVLASGSPTVINSVGLGYTAGQGRWICW